MLSALLRILCLIHYFLCLLKNTVVINIQLLILEITMIVSLIKFIIELEKQVLQICFSLWISNELKSISSKFFGRKEIQDILIFQFRTYSYVLQFFCKKLLNFQINLNLFRLHLMNFVTKNSFFETSLVDFLKRAHKTCHCLLTDLAPEKVFQFMFFSQLTNLDAVTRP